MPFRKHYIEKLPLKNSLHNFYGMSKVTNNVSYYNPFFEIRKRHILKNKKFYLNSYLGIQYITLSNSKVGEWDNYSQGPAWSYFKGTQYNTKNELTPYLGGMFGYKLFNFEDLLLTTNFHIRVDYPAQMTFTNRFIGMNNTSNNIDELNRSTISYSNFDIISFGSINMKYKLSQHFFASSDFNIPFFYLLDIYKDPSVDPYNYSYNTPSYILDYRSSIFNINYLTINLSVNYQFK